MQAMSFQDRDQGPKRGSRRRARGAVLVAILLTGLAAAAVILVTRPGSTPSAHRLAARCVTTARLPEVARVSPKVLGDLREDVARVLPQRVGRLYEEGTVRSSVAWSDEDPRPPAAEPSARRPAGYEMRWWAPNGDDVVADVLVFGSPDEARRYLLVASGGHCREHAIRSLALHPPLARNLSWLNPDGALQADVFMARGARVYRVADAPAGSSPEQVRTSGSLDRALSTIDVLACLLPSARCTRTPPGVAT
jgi:hypothetical protein